MEPFKMNNSNFGFSNLPSIVKRFELKNGLVVHRQYAAAQSIEEKEKGESTMNVVLTILSMLQLDEVVAVPTGCFMDEQRKIDIIVRLGHVRVGFQVKSSQYGIIKHIEKSDVGVVWCNSNSNMTELLEAFSRWLNVPIKKIVLEALDKINLMKTLGINTADDPRLQILRITNNHVALLLKLKVVRIKQKKIEWKHG
jgi:hypothetical protein